MKIVFNESNDAIQNVFLMKCTDFMLNGYLKMLGVVLQQGSTINSEQCDMYKRIIAGTNAEFAFEDYLRMALQIEKSDFAEFTDEIKDIPIKYRFVLDAFILACISEQNADQVKLIVAFCELLHITQIELKYLVTLAKVIVEMNSTEVAKMYYDKNETIPFNVASGYVICSFVQGGINENKVLPIKVDALQKIKFILEKYKDDKNMFIAVCPSLDDIGYVTDMHYYEEDIHSKYEAKKRACKQFTTFYMYAQKCFDQNSSNNVANIAADKLFHKIKNDAMEITDIINQMDELIKERHTTIIKELLEAINTDNLCKRIKKLCEEELCATYYHFEEMSYYVEKIEYESIEHYPSIFNKKDWWYNGMEAWIELDEDLDKKAEAYRKYITKKFCQEVISPIIDLVERIQK